MADKQASEPSLGDMMKFLQNMDKRIQSLEKRPKDDSQVASGSGVHDDNHDSDEPDEIENSRREREDASAWQAGVGTDPENDCESHSQTETQSETQSVDFDYVVRIQDREKSENVLDLMVKDLHEDEKTGPPVVEQLERIVRNRFAVKPRENTIPDLNRKYLFPENCTIMDTPVLNEQIKSKLSKNAAKVDTWLSNIQLCVGKAAAAAVGASEKIHAIATDVAGKIGSTEHAHTHVVKGMNETLSQIGDVIALLGNAHQDLSVRRRYQLQTDLPKDVQAVCTMPVKPGQSDKLFGEDLDKNLRLARESYRNKGQRYHPYRQDRGRGGSSSSFLGRGSGRPYRRPNQYQRGAGRGFRK